MSRIKIAVLSDIHGNTLALERVLDDIKQRGVDQIVNLGDSFYGPLDPAGTADIITEMDIPSVSGNEDRELLDDENAAHSPSIAYTKNCLICRHWDWLNLLPKTRILFDDFFLCHGTPESDTTYLLHEINNGNLILRSDEDITALTHSIQQKIILCGHDHTPNFIQLKNGKVIINPGSVGCPAYYSGETNPHKSERGSPHARYSIVTIFDDDLTVENIALTYDWEAAAKLALENGRPDWVNWLKYGRI